MGVILVTEAATAIVERDRPALEQLIKELRSDVDGAPAVLEELAGHPAAVVRDWVAWIAPSVIASGAVPILERLVDDKDADVRHEAMSGLVRLDKRWSAKLVPRYLKMLRSHDPIDQVDAIWRLTQFRESSALAALKQIAQTGRYPGLRTNAQVASLVLEGKEDELIAGLLRHEHKVVLLWTRGLAYLGTERALNVLRQFAEEAPDAECREHARRSLAAEGAVRLLSRN
jgi:HEAT repeat protein